MLQLKLNRANFLQLSSGLTGVTLKQLSPSADPVGIADQYCETLEQCLDQQRLSDIATMLDNVTTTSVEEFLDNKTFGPLARMITKMWFLGGFYDPRTPSTQKKVVSSQAYKESLVWRAMQSHPMGYSMLPFEHWSKEPEGLNVFFAS